MLRRQAAKLALLAILLILVGGAVALKYAAWAEGQRPPTDSEAQISAVLVAAGFDLSEWGGDPRVVSGLNGDCEIYVMLPSYGGDHQDVIRQISVGYNLKFLFEGQSYDTQPGLQTRLHYYWIRFLDTIGFAEERSLLMALIWSPSCPSVPMDELLKLSQ